jgi:hypothetical protein
MADPFSADIPIIDKTGFPTSYLEQYIYQLHHVEEGSPTSSGQGDAGELRRDSDYLYVCYATDSWGRIALTKGY